MDYEKKFEKLVDAVKVLRDNNPSDEGIQNWVNDNVPELKESENERTRKGLTDFLKGKFENPCSPTPSKKVLAGWIAWLEKQGEKELDPRYSILDKLIEADDIYQMSINDTMVGEAKNKAIEALSNLEISKLLGLEKQDKSSSEVHYWTEEEIEPIISDYLRGAEHYGGMIGRLRCLKPKLLEKQGEQKTFDTDTIKKKAHQIAWEISKHYDPNACKQEWCEMAAIDMASWLEKQGEHKSINYADEEIVEAVKDISVLDMAEQKFNVGDTIIKKHNSDINDFGQFTITDITGGKYWYNDRIICDIREQDEWEMIMIKECAANHYIKDSIDFVITWLKSIKDRIKGE